MKADLFIKAVLFLEHWLNNASEEQFRKVSRFIYNKALETDEDIWNHLDDFIRVYYSFSRDGVAYLPAVPTHHIVNLLVFVDRFLIDEDWDAILDASEKLADLFNNNREVYDKYDSFFFDFSWDYGRPRVSSYLLYEDPIPDDEEEDE